MKIPKYRYFFSDSMNSDSIDIIANGPSRARPKKQSEKSLTLENIREAQLNDKELCNFLKWLEDPDFQVFCVLIGLIVIVRDSAFLCREFLETM